MAAIVNSSVVLPVSYEREIIRGVLGRSKALELGRKLPDMNTKTLKLNVLSQLPIAGWVSKQATPATAPGEIKDKPLSVLAWEGVDVVAEEVAVIVPVAISTLQDTEDYGVSVVPTIGEQVVGAFADVIDSAIFFGTNTPFTGNLANGLVGNANAKSVTWDGSAGTSFYDAINQAMSYVEASGYRPNAILGGPSLNSAFRGAITTLGVNVADQGEIGALPRHIDLTGGFNESTAFAIVGDFDYLVYSIREGMTMRLLTEATLIDGDGTTRYNLAQQDMVAFRFTMRLGFALPNPVNRVGGATRFPFAKIVKE